MKFQNSHQKVFCILISYIVFVNSIAVSTKKPARAKAIIYNEAGSDYTVWLDANDCRNFTGYWNDDTYSALVERKCVQIFEDSGCQGDRRLLCSSEDEYVFHEMNFKNKLSSVGSCSENEILACEQPDPEPES